MHNLGVLSCEKLLLRSTGVLKDTFKFWFKYFHIIL